MVYKESVELTIRDMVRNSLGVLFISVLFSAALAPFATTALVSGRFAWLAGLWTSCLLCGVVVVAGFRLATEIAARHESIPTTPFWRALREEWPAGIAIGTVTFCLAILAAVLLNLPLSGLAGQTIGLAGIYAAIGWGLLLGFALPVYSRTERSDDGPFPVAESRFALAAGVEMLVREPLATLWLLVQAAGWTFIAAITLVTPVLLLPGFLVLFAAEIAELVIPWEELDTVAPVSLLSYRDDANF